MKESNRPQLELSSQAQVNGGGGDQLNATGEQLKPNDTHMDMSEIGGQNSSVDAGDGGKMRAFYLNDHARN